jgi:uncharacterized protein YegL
LKKLLLATLLFIILLPVTLAVTQEARAPRLEITGLNPANLPTVTVTVNVFDSVNQPVAGLTAEDFRVVGALADQARVVQVRSFSDEAVPISVVLAIDVSSSMAGMPIESARAAANLFIDSIQPDDPVAVVTFSSGARLVQDFTTDKALLRQVINGLGFGGETFLFDGARAAVEQAAASDGARRAVILLSDGAQYDTTNSSRYTERDALNAAVINGVPVYTIGLGFGADRHYLQNLSRETNALFRESPSPAELEAIYSELAALLRTQYEVTLAVDVPLDGTTYDLTMEVTTPEGTAQDSGRLRAPVPVPVVRLPELPGLVDQLIEVQADIAADDPLTGVTVALDGVEQFTLNAPPYVYIIDPVALAPGAHSLTFAATDEDGDTGTASLTFEVAALPSVVEIVPALEGEIAQAQTFEVRVTGQTAPVSVSLTQDGGDPVVLTEPYSFSIDPFMLAPGAHTVAISVTNAGGVTSLTEASFTVPDLPIQFVVSGLEAGQQVDDVVTVQVDVSSSQGAVSAVRFALNGEPLAESAPNTVVLRAADLQPGPAVLAVTVENALGQSNTTEINFRVAALPPQITIAGLDLGETLDADREIIFEIASQTPITGIQAQIDGALVALTGQEPPSLLLDVLAIGPGAHVLLVTASNAGGQSATFETAFSVAEGPSLTATAQVTPSEMPTFTPSPTPETSPTPTVDALPTVLARANELAATAGVQATGQARVTAAAATAEVERQEAMAATDAALDQAATAALGALVARITQTAEARALGTTEADSTVQAAVTLDAQSSATQQAEALAQATAQAAVNATATADLVATVNAQQTATVAAEQAATSEALGTVTQESAEAMTATQAAVNATATADLIATANAQQTATVAAEQAATSEALGTVTQESAEAMTATQAAAARQATADAALTQTQAAAVQATNAANATTTAEAQANATTTAETAAQAALDEQATADAQATANAAPTQTQAAAVQATNAANATTTAEAQANATTTAETAAQAALDEQATADAQATEADATAAAQATSSAEATSAAEPTEEVIAGATDVIPTEAGTEVAQAATSVSATPTTGGADASPVPTITPIGTLIPAQAESVPSNDTLIPLAVIIVVIVVVLLLAYLLLSRSRRNKR